MWWHDYGDTVPPAFADFLDLEGAAKYIQTWQPLVIPGLLQTEGYTRAVLEANPAAVRPERIDQLVNCVETGSILAGGMAVRDSKDPSGPALAFPADAWRGFITALKTGELPTT
ncbi:Scr1 family TA system antitoxin-like transcriptional regulator [Kitasatospora sp. NPDC096128]|uniref:DUF397 domain-containing protein n=1 Tax=Kitasatospora sp. NPDC096128 TaxID=3155547 RepID=UPI00332E91AC